ncbi:MAG: hypothetical protein MJ133_09535 [Lachnospiraceae bacterium]|nr:hypothetical protein [Lachnospiraceae bacterium]
MGIALYGNINGYTYRPPQLNLMDSAKSQNSNPTTVSSAYPDMPAVEVNISEEELKALHGSKLPGSADPFETAAKIAYMSEHQPIESYESKFSQMIPSSYEMNERGEAVYVHHTNEEKIAALSEGFKSLVDEINKGYDEGTRVRFVEDPTSEDGFRKLTREEELDILQQEFDDFVDSRFGKERAAEDAKIKESLDALQELKKSLGRETKEYKLEALSDEEAEGLKAKMKSLVGANGKIAVPEMTEEQKAEREAKIKAFQESIVYYEESPFKINITRDERNIMMSFEPEEYSSIIERMKKDAPEIYANHKTALEEARANGDTSGVFREYAGAYKWAYGDIFDKIHEKEPDVDIYIKSASTTKDHDYHFINNSKRLVISTDEMKLLQSKNPKDADKQEKLWLDIFDRINNSMK